MKPKPSVTLGGPAVSWITKGKLLATSLLYLIVAAPGVASAASSGSVPTVDIATTCRESQKAIVSIFGPDTQQTLGNCLKQENEAREQIVKNWLDYPAGGRQRCINTTGYMPSYVEWLTCLEMEQQVLELRKRSNPAATNPATTDGRGKR